MSPKWRGFVFAGPAIGGKAAGLGFAGGFAGGLAGDVFTGTFGSCVLAGKFAGAGFVPAAFWASVAASLLDVSFFGAASLKPSSRKL
jgi:hypothetical protein